MLDHAALECRRPVWSGSSLQGVHRHNRTRVFVLSCHYTGYLQSRCVFVVSCGLLLVRGLSRASFARGVREVAANAMSVATVRDKLRRFSAGVGERLIERPGSGPYARCPVEEAAAELFTMVGTLYPLVVAVR